MGGKALDGRLSCIAAMVPAGGTAVDVGSDHGRLIAHLVQSGRVQRGIATDINPGPLEKTRALLCREGLTGRVDALLTDGLTGVEPHGVATVIIAGMGGELIFDILSAWPHRKTPGITWLLQPMTKAPYLRRSLWEAGFALGEERCCYAGGRGYTVLRVGYAGAPQLYLPWQPYVGGLVPRTPRDAAFLGQYRRRLLAVADARERSAGPTPNTAALREAARQLDLLLHPGAQSWGTS